MANASGAHTKGAFGTKQFALAEGLARDKTGAFVPYKCFVGVVRPTRFGIRKPRFLRGKNMKKFFKFTPTKEDKSAEPSKVVTKHKGFKGAVAKIFNRKGE